MNRFLKWASALFATAVAMVASSAAHAYALLSTDIQPIADGITANIGVLMPIMLTVLATGVGAVIVFKLVKRFTSASV